MNVKIKFDETMDFSKNKQIKGCVCMCSVRVVLNVSDASTLCRYDKHNGDLAGLCGVCAVVCIRLFIFLVLRWCYVFYVSFDVASVTFLWVFFV